MEEEIEDKLDEKIKKLKELKEQLDKKKDIQEMSVSDKLKVKVLDENGVVKEEYESPVRTRKL